jgi:hypothetical protein
MAQPLQINRDYTIDPAGRYVFTREYLLARGECCGSGCQNCPYPPRSNQNNIELIKPKSIAENRK